MKEEEEKVGGCDLSDEKIRNLLGFFFISLCFLKVDIYENIRVYV